ncbi:hypothetical protein GCM10011351_26200 [Paraliobacillus quinghaiensis]|uniref:YitT family protein n=1 Tax=Paraliobacillus quinghaiensis TaxID=470815 RepID=A0A917TUV3_9BACI|nr:YitT family protein [Paraliobacillus quinghaiensis]GGM38835.1 hypothetical protein GCM10011351_26200 [Paraliobacillus quinghaiensis]
MVLQRFIFYTLGIFIMTLGIALTIQSLLGASPFDALLVGLHRTFGFTVGSWEIVLGSIMVLSNALAEKRRPEYFALITSFITGACIDFWLLLLNDLINPEVFFMQMIVLLTGMIVSSLGIAVNLQADFAPNPMDRSMLVIRKLTGLNIFVSRGLLSIVLVIFAFIFSGAIGIGTLIYALLSGLVINYFMPFVAKFERKKIHQVEQFK